MLHQDIAYFYSRVNKTIRLSFKIIDNLGLKEHPGPCVKLPHPFDPVQTHYVHQAFHHIQHKHHSNSSHEEDYTPHDRYSWLLS